MLPPLVQHFTSNYKIVTAILGVREKIDLKINPMGHYRLKYKPLLTTRTVDISQALVNSKIICN